MKNADQIKKYVLGAYIETQKHILRQLLNQ
jgi:hypothetical protein